VSDPGELNVWVVPEVEDMDGEDQVQRRQIGERGGVASQED